VKGGKLEFLVAVVHPASQGAQIGTETSSRSGTPLSYPG
jgi:hypothetical protein